MSSDRSITRELGVGEVITKTFNLYKFEFVKYFVLFLVVYAVYGAVLTAVQNTITTTPVPANATGRQIVDWFTANAGGLVGSGALRSLLFLVF